jgi:hypothetical protein
MNDQQISLQLEFEETELQRRVKLADDRGARASTSCGANKERRAAWLKVQ